VLSLSNGYLGKWYGSELSNSLSKQEDRQCLATTVENLLAKTAAAGINIDFESLSVSDKDPFLEFLNLLATSFARQRKIISC